MDSDVSWSERYRHAGAVERQERCRISSEMSRDLLLLLLQLKMHCQQNPDIPHQLHLSSLPFS
jgi:hypothetical protein